MLIGIMGTPVTSGNRGVLALGASLVNLCAGKSGAEIVLLLGRPDNRPVAFQVAGKERFIRVVNHRLSPRARLRDQFFWILFMAILYRLLPVSAVRHRIATSTPWIRALEDCRVVGDVRGGDSFSDIYGWRRFILGFLSSWTVVLVKGTIVQFPQTFGPYKSFAARWLARYLLKRSSVIIARDSESQRVAQEMVGAGMRVLLSPDVAFSLEPIAPKEIVLDPPIDLPSQPFRDLHTLKDFRPGLIGLNVNGLMFNGGYTRNNMFGLKMDYPSFLHSLVCALLAEHPGELWLVPHTYAPFNSVESDNEAARKLRADLPAELRHRVRLIHREYNQHELKWLIGQCDFFIGSRMHSCIAALSQGVPCVGVAYSKKFAGVFETVGMGRWVVDGRSTSDSDAVAAVLALYWQRNSVKAALSQRADQARQDVERVFQDLTAQFAPRAAAPDVLNAISSSIDV